MANAETIRRCLVILGAAYPRFPVPAETASVYAQLLADVDDALLVAAVKHHAATSKWFPTVAELREAALELRDVADGVPTAEEAWGEVCEKMRRYPPVPLENGWRVPEFSHPLILKAVNVLGGWVELGRSENGIADRAHFFQIYPQLVARRRADVALLPSVRETIARLARQRSLPQRVVDSTAQAGDTRSSTTGASKGAAARPSAAGTPLTPVDSHGRELGRFSRGTDTGFGGTETGSRAADALFRARKPTSRGKGADSGVTSRGEAEVYAHPEGPSAGEEGA